MSVWNINREMKSVIEFKHNEIARLESVEVEKNGFWKRIGMEFIGAEKIEKKRGCPMLVMLCCSGWDIVVQDGCVDIMEEASISMTWFCSDEQREEGEDGIVGDGELSYKMQCDTAALQMKWLGQEGAVCEVCTGGRQLVEAEGAIMMLEQLCWDAEDEAVAKFQEVTGAVDFRQLELVDSRIEDNWSKLPPIWTQLQQVDPTWWRWSLAAMVVGGGGSGGGWRWWTVVVIGGGGQWWSSVVVVGGVVIGGGGHRWWWAVVAVGGGGRRWTVMVVVGGGGQ
ncbi:hypothetical protein C5167_046453 [Papaver somniferum]|uniref:Uncharacterized protein n=1 Tax=Papaver somniferum TaxID=3469 RepID=A0A4Y7LG39_PAPSO|nr:hypothetical protein C5167_046453 [Papaver somniferum]